MPSTAALPPAATEPDTLPALDRGAGSHTAVLRVVVADDHPLFRQAVCSAVARHPGLALVGEAADGEEALALIEALEPDVAVLDQRMPGLRGADVCEALQARTDRPATALLMLSAFEDADLVWGAVSAGAAGYLGKGASQGEICEAIERVGRGGNAFTERTARGLATGLARHVGAGEAGPAA
jgi:two-component system nitrate/nitrite response regulator NarL